MPQTAEQPTMKSADLESVPVGLRGLGKDYGGFTALRSLDLNVPHGTCFGFLGPNGAGKTTTIKIMTNLIRPTRGRAALFGIDVQRDPKKALGHVGAVIETPEFYGYLSPLETLAYAGRLRGMPKTAALRSDSAIVLPRRSLIALSPTTPSPPIPLISTPRAPGPKTAAADAMSRSADGE